MMRRRQKTASEGDHTEPGPQRCASSKIETTLRHPLLRRIRPAAMDRKHHGETHRMTRLSPSPAAEHHFRKHQVTI
jgi:hypothetical protein